MKRILKLAGITAIVFVINVAMLVGVVGLVAVNAGPGPSGNGDINGDGSINVADAVALLAYLFEGGPEPAAIASSTCSAETWPPRPELMFYKEDFSGPELFPGEAHPIFVVPSDMWFVMAEDSTSLPTRASLGVASSRVLNSDPNSSGALGIVVAPGETLEMFHPSWWGTGSYSADYRIRGYFVPTDRPVVGGCWPPHPENIISLDDGAESVSVPALGVHEVYTVPIGQHFVITNLDRSGDDSVRLIASSGGVDRQVLLDQFTMDTQAGIPGVGPVVEAGEALRFENLTGAAYSVSYHIAGYLVPMTP